MPASTRVQSCTGMASLLNAWVAFIVATFGEELGALPCGALQSCMGTLPLSASGITIDDGSVAHHPKVRPVPGPQDLKSPFPGMDPYLEQFWPDLHASLIIYTRDQIEEQLPATLIARVEERIVLEVEED